MQKSNESGLATHIGSESCGAAREGGDEALTGERAGPNHLQTGDKKNGAAEEMPASPRGLAWQTQPAPPSGGPLLFLLEGVQVALKIRSHL